MHVHTFKARTLQEALRLVREELGPDASVLETREVGSAWSRWLVGAQIEVTASADVRVPSRLPGSRSQEPDVGGRESGVGLQRLPSVFPADLLDFRQMVREQLRSHADDESSLVEQLAIGQAPRLTPRRDNHDRCTRGSFELPIAEPLEITPGRRLVVALVGPTGVGKTTTIAKLAAHFRLREQCRVGLVTVDTYRIAAVEQLKTYAEIMDLPLEVVTTPRQMRAAADRLAEMDVVLIDTAGRSPRDAVRLAELRGLLAESQADEVQLVLSAVAGPDTIDVAAGAFSTVGASALILTKLDEAVALDWLPGLLQRHRLPLSYITNGQNVPDDIQPASAKRLTRLIAGFHDGKTEGQSDGETTRFSPSLRLSVSPSES